MTVQVVLPDELAVEAQEAGLLSDSRVEAWLREQLRQRRLLELSEAMRRAVALDNGTFMSPEDVAEEVRAMRAERRSLGQ